jgi:hypothetical protein
MRFFWDERRIERLETKVDDGFAAVRSEHRADFRMLVGLTLAMFMTMLLGFAGIMVTILLQSA